MGRGGCVLRIIRRRKRRRDRSGRSEPHKRETGVRRSHATRADGASADASGADEARRTRLEQLQNAYTNRAPSMGYMAPKMPDGYRVRVEEPTAGSGKTRIVDIFN